VGKAVKNQLGEKPKPDNRIKPAVILVNPQLGENIGASCRCMLNFGLTELRLVAPRDGWPNPAALSMAAGAAPVLEAAKVFATTSEAIADLKYVLAATARRRNKETPTGILFGPEKAGLTNADVALCDAILTYPVNPAFQSLNLAQAVNVFSYIWKSAETMAPPELFQTEIGDTAPRERENDAHATKYSRPVYTGENDRTGSSHLSRYYKSFGQRARCEGFNKKTYRPSVASA